MAMTQTDFPSVGAEDWTDDIDIRKDWIVGHNDVGLTNFTNSSVPQLAQGSKTEIGGAYFVAGSDQTPTGSIIDTDINYIYIETDGDVKWGNTDPTWDTTKYGWYNGTDKAVAGLYRDGSNYINKFLYQGYEKVYGLVKRFYSPALSGSLEVDAINFNGSDASIGAGGKGHILVDLPHGAVVTELFSQTIARTAGAVDINLKNSLLSSASDTQMAQNTHNAIETQTDSSITDATIDNETKCYRIEIDATGAASGIQLSGIRITYTITEPLP